MGLFRVYVDGALFYHPHMSKLAITQAQIQEDAENIDSLTLSAPHNHVPHGTGDGRRQHLPGKDAAEYRAL